MERNRQSSKLIIEKEYLCMLMKSMFSLKERELGKSMSWYGVLVDPNADAVCGFQFHIMVFYSNYKTINLGHYTN